MRLLDYLYIALFLFIIHFLLGYKRRYLLKNGTSAEAEVISIEKTIFNVGSGMSKPVMKIVLKIDNLGITDAEVTIRKTFGDGEIEPDAGDKVKVLFDPKRPKKLLMLRTRNDGATYYL